jgi:hypothetical protein
VVQPHTGGQTSWIKTSCLSHCHAIPRLADLVRFASLGSGFALLASGDEAVQAASMAGGLEGRCKKKNRKFNAIKLAGDPLNNFTYHWTFFCSNKWGCSVQTLELQPYPSAGCRPYLLSEHFQTVLSLPLQSTYWGGGGYAVGFQETRPTVGYYGNCAPWWSRCSAGWHSICVSAHTDVSVPCHATPH